MSKRIHFAQQRPLSYKPIMAGLSHNPEAMLGSHPCPECAAKKNKSGCQTCKGTGTVQLTPKLYTTRTKPLHGEYVVIGGSRYKPFIVEPKIQFHVEEVWKLNLRTAKICEYEPYLGISDGGLWWDVDEILSQITPAGSFTFAELDIGIKGISLDQYRSILLNLNKNVTLDTTFYINQLLPAGDDKE